MSGQLRKPKFVRKLEFDASNSEDDRNKMKSCKLVSRGRNNSTLPINLNSSFASLKNNCSSEENPFLSKKNPPPLTRQRDLFDVISKSSKNEPKLKTITNKRTSPKISSTSKVRLKINRCTKKDAILLRKKVDVTSNSNTPKSSKIEPVLYSPRSTSKFAVSDCLDTSKSSSFGHSPSFKLQGNISWKETSVSDSQPNTEAINLSNSPCFVVSTQFDKKKEIFKRSKLKNAKIMQDMCKKQWDGMIGINSEFLKTDPRKSVNFSPELVLKTGKEDSKAELGKSPTILKEMSRNRFPRVPITPNTENQDYQNNQNLERSPEIKLVPMKTITSPNVYTRTKSQAQDNQRSTCIKDASPIIKSVDSNKEKNCFENESEEMIIDSPLVKTNSIRSKRKNKITKILKDSKFKKDNQSPLKKTKGWTNENILSSPEIIKSSPVVSKNPKLNLKKFSKSNKTMNNLDGKNDSNTIKGWENSLIIGISPNYSKRISGLKSPEVVPGLATNLDSTSHKKIKSDDNLKPLCKSPVISILKPTIPIMDAFFSENILKCKSPEILSLKRKRPDHDNKSIISSENSPNASVCKSPEIALVKFNYADRSNSMTNNSQKVPLSKSPEISFVKSKCIDKRSKNPDILFSKNSPKTPHCNLPENSSLEQKYSDYQEKKSNISFLENSQNVSLCNFPKVFMGNQTCNNEGANSDTLLSKNFLNASLSKSPEILSKQKSSEKQMPFSDLSCSPKTPLCKSQEILLVKRKDSEKHQGKPVISFADNSPKIPLCKSPEILLLRPKCSEMHENIHSAYFQTGVPLIIGMSPKCVSNTNFKKKNITSINKSPIVFPQKRKITESPSLENVKKKILEPHKLTSVVSVPEHPFSKSPEIVLLKQQSLDNLAFYKSPGGVHKNLITTTKVSFFNKSPEISSVEEKQFPVDKNLDNIFPGASTNEISSKCSALKNVKRIKEDRQNSSIKKPQSIDSKISLAGKYLNESYDDRIVNNHIFVNKEKDVDQSCIDNNTSLIVETSPKSFISSLNNVQKTHENSIKSPACDSPEIVSIEARTTNIQDKCLLNSSIKTSLRKSSENSTPNLKNIAGEQEKLNSSFINPNQLIIGFSPKCFNSPLRNIKKNVHKNLGNTSNSPEMTSIKRNRSQSIDINHPLIIGVSPSHSSLRSVKKNVPETQETSPLFCKSPEMSLIKRRVFDVQLPVRTRKEEMNSNNSHSYDTPSRKSHRLALQVKESAKKPEEHGLKISNAENLLQSLSSYSPKISNSPISISSSPLINKIKSKRVRILFSSKESCSSPQEVQIESSSEKVAVLDEIFMKKCVAPVNKPGLETQLIDEFYTETLHLAGTNTKSEGWSSEAAISEILSEEKSRQLKSNGESLSPKVPVIKPPRRKKLKSRDSASAQLDAARNALVSERRIREYERSKNGECSAESKEFNVIEVWGTRPQKIQAITDEGEAILILGEGLVYSPDDVKPGCIVRIYPPWQTLITAQGITIYLSIRICDVLPGCLPEDINAFADMEEEISIQPYLEDPNRIMRVLLNEPDSDN